MSVMPSMTSAKGPCRCVSPEAIQGSRGDNGVGRQLALVGAIPTAAARWHNVTASARTGEASKKEASHRRAL